MKRKMHIALSKLAAKNLPKWLDVLLAGLIILMFSVLIIGGIFFTLFVAIFIPSLLGAFVTWFCWTYLEIGVVYFPELPARWQSIPFLHIWTAFVAILWIIRSIALATRPSTKKHGFNDELRDGTGLTHSMQRRMHLRSKRTE